MKRLKAFFKRSTVIRKLHKNYKKKLWEITDFFKLKYYNIRGYSVIHTHYARLNNFGDLFNIDLLNFLGYKLIYRKDWSTAEIALTGSILQHYSPKFKGYILGAGFIDNKKKIL